MISIKRMKIDLAAQAILLTGLIVAGLGELPWGWCGAFLALLVLWQIGSALHLAIVYEYQQRYPLLWALLLSALAVPPGTWLFGTWALAPLNLALAAYFWITIRDTRTLSQRPRSFWDL